MNLMVRMGVALGLRAWMAYAATEVLCVAYLPWMLQRHVMRPQDPEFLAYTLGIYSLAGTLLGGAAGWLLPRLYSSASERSLTALITGTMILVLSANIVGIEARMLSPRILVLPVVLALVALSGWPGAWGARLASFGNPWVASLLVVGVQWLTREYLVARSPSMRLGGLVVFELLVFAGGLAAARLSAQLTLRTRVLAGVISALVICAAALLLHPAPLTASTDAQSVAASRRPTVLLIVLDTVRADHLSVYGYERDTSPNLRQFAQAATVFRHAYSSGDMTLPSHASMFTGLYPAEHGAHYSFEAPSGRPLDDSHRTLAEILAANGYDTAAVVANGGYLTAALGFQQGFAHYDQRLPAVPLRSSPAYLLRAPLLRQTIRWSPNLDLCQRSRDAAQVNESLFALLKNRTRRNLSLFLLANYMDAHYPYLPPAPFDTRYPGKLPSYADDDYQNMWTRVMVGNAPIEEAHRQHLVSQYDGSMAFLDAQLGRLFSYLREQGLFEDALIVVTADHGEAIGERATLDHGGIGLHQDQIRVPLVIKFPKQHTAATVDTPVSSVDIFATVLDIAGLPIPPSTSGHSLARPNPGEEPFVVAESYPGGRALKQNPQRFNLTYRAILKGPWKLIRSSNGKRELYNLEDDPQETTNVFTENLALAQQLDSSLSAWVRAKATAVKPGSRLDPATLERLKSLGYVQ